MVKMSMTPEGVQPQCTKICAEVEQNNPGKVRNVWGYNTTPDHNNRRCVDYMIFDKAGGDQVVQYHLDDRSRLLVDLIIWNRRIIRSYDKPGIPKWTWAPYYGEDPHTDHPHVQYKVGVYVPPDNTKPPEIDSPVKVNDTALVLATVLNGRAEPNTGATIIKTRPYGDTFVVKAVQDGWAKDDSAWFSGEYLFAQLKPDPKNTAGIKKGDKVRVTANGGLRARLLPGGPLSTDSAGNAIVRPTNYQFNVTDDPKQGWITGGSNWYSSDFLGKVNVTPPPKPPPVTKPGWVKDPIVKLSMAKIPSPVNYLQAVVRVAGVDSSHGKWAPIYVLAQDPNGKGDTRFLAFSANGTYINSMTVKDGGHGQTFHAYRSAAGNLYIWTLIGSIAYRISWQPGKTVTAKSKGVTKMAYGNARPVGTYEHYVGFRAANSTKETFTLHDRFGFTDPDHNSAKPIKKVSLAKDTSPTQQSWAVTDTRIYRFRGKTNTDAGKGSKKHVLDVYDWSGRALLRDFDVTAMSLPGATSDEPEGVTFSGTPGTVLVGKRSGPSNKSRTYPIWQMVGLP